jgi:predicted acylesterase/phospholipase RssA
MSVPMQPFKEMAICLSGGGYRAASFHLGSLSYLHKIKVDDTNLIKNVKAISTVSGGTITGVLYALRDNQGASFEMIYQEVMDVLRNHDLIKESLAKLKRDGHWNNQSKSRNLINAFSEIYNDLLTLDCTYSDLTDVKRGHLDFCAFNATEFSSGINFRFQSEWRNGKQNKQLRRGNNNYTLSFNAQNEVKLADIIAASSCFPGGFEPIGFPDDFIHKDCPELLSLKEKKSYESAIGLMDGGIYDNQGIDSIQLSERRRGKAYSKIKPDHPVDRLPYDLVIISDVSSPDISHPFRFHKTKESSLSHLSFRKVESFIHLVRSVTFWIPILLIIGGIALGFLNDWENAVGTGIALMLMLFGVIFLVINNIFWGRLKKVVADLGSMIRKSIGEFYLKKIAKLDLKDYTVREIEPLFYDRMNSLSLMVQDIFLKQVRRLKYASIYEDAIYDNRRVANLIKELTIEDWDKTRDYQDCKEVDKALQGSYNDVIGNKIKVLAKEASSFGTTLWFTDEDKLVDILDKLVALGQATMCFNLMVYITKLKNDPDFLKIAKESQERVETIFNQCKSDWKLFKNDPKFYVKVLAEPAINN